MKGEHHHGDMSYMCTDEIQNKNIYSDLKFVLGHVNNLNTLR